MGSFLLSGLAPATVASAAPTGSPGYWLLGGDGGVFSFGSTFAGSAATDPRHCPANTTDRQEPDGTCLAMAATPDGGGYWILNGDMGVIFGFGDANFFGDPAATFAGVPREFVPDGRAIVATPTGKGYWVLTVGLSGLGSVMAFGDAATFGDPLGAQLAHAGVPVGMAATLDGKGYWIVDSDGGVFSFGDAPFLGSMGGRRLAAQVVGIAPDPAAPGYWLAAADGGVFSFGPAPFRGSLGATHLARPIFSITSTAHGL